MLVPVRTVIHECTQVRPLGPAGEKILVERGQPCAMKPDFHGVRTLLNCGFIAFRRVRSARAAMLTVLTALTVLTVLVVLT